MNVGLLSSFFKARTDVFAIHWQKNKRSGYMPAYSYDPYMYRLHKIKGGSFKDYKDKTYQNLSTYQIEKHLLGKQLIGIYPLLKDNTSWFIAADFDKQNWAEECRKLIEVCAENDISAYLERSRSGNGGHIWIFFEQAYPAYKSRKVIIKLMEKAGLFSIFEKNSSFDRLFPNQDYHNGKGLGNLIALPFYKPAVEKGNSCFVDPSDAELKTYKDQEKFLSEVKKTSIDQLNQLYDSFGSESEKNSDIKNPSTKLEINLSNILHLNKSGINATLTNFLKEELNFANSEFFLKKKLGKNTWKTKPYFNCVEDTEKEIILPRGFVGKLIRFCKNQKLNYNFNDKRKKKTFVNLNCEVKLRAHQELAIKAAARKDFGIISAPPGSGKTIIGLKIISEKRQPALIVVHRRQLMEQWIERIQTFFGVPKNEIGKIGQGKTKLGKKINVAMIQSLGKYIEKQEEGEELTQRFGTLIVDECHHIPAKTYRNTISKFSSYYQYGLTATPFRKGNDEKLLFAYLGEKIAVIKPNDIEEYKHPRIVIRNTSLDIPFNSKTDTFETLSKILIHDSARNSLILKDVETELKLGKKVVIITERKEHIDTLNQYLKQSYDTVALSGENSEANRKAKWKILNRGDYQILITTGQFFGEGSDLQNASSLFLAYPFSFKGKLIQYIGRVQRSELTPVIYDYRDYKIDYLNRLFLKRNKHYRNFDKQATLFDDNLQTIASSQLLTIDKKVKIKIAHLDFRYGAVAFEYHISNKDEPIEFEIENNELRPEFDVLKPYFSRVLKQKYIEVEIYAEYENESLVAQSAYSKDIELIDQELIKSVRFRFVEKDILRKPPSNLKNGNLTDLKSLLRSNNISFYNSEENLINDLLKTKDVKHYRQIKYLASRHKKEILKLRFVLQPFSFVFLISGEKAYHIVLETLNTEEATYIWHLDKSIDRLKQHINMVDKDLGEIRNDGRQKFLANTGSNFSRIIHDYSNERKGFIIWKSALEERLF
ncbi:Superfamily II DNA or RNA helicase [Salegentibacter echinorum]|uniref:Superfamily II DNA or RNA helicase n=1 Tax=Salegentibacter echinorum TaxID=1073325 RepID=A0A1M5FNS4_SALEC|nr:DEAD/DEAH box helicase [Salegentibacter echinorum]SHF93190.1 Superfamily II DNA or RNA helicase [Salegentibacter echinorum]